MFEVIYHGAKIAHVTCVILTFLGFVLRGWWVMVDSPLLQHALTKRIPPLIDSLLLLSALTLVYVTHQYPGVQSWLTAKVIALVFYIGFGMVAITYGRSKGMRLWAWGAAVGCFFYIVGTALTRHPWPFPYLSSALGF